MSNCNFSNNLRLLIFCVAKSHDYQERMIFGKDAFDEKIYLLIKIPYSLWSLIAFHFLISAKI